MQVRFEPFNAWSVSVMIELIANNCIYLGVSFPEPYVPHGVKMKYDGKDVDLNPVEEEAYVLLFFLPFSIFRHSIVVSFFTPFFSLKSHFLCSHGS
jgi:hypothetical protein